MKKWVKILLFSFLAIIIMLGVAFGYIYFQIEGKYVVNQKKYAHIIGYLDPANEDPTPSFTRCNDANKRPIGYYSSASGHYPVFNGSKSTFRAYILENFDKKSYTDSGFLNLRFLINCKNEIGDMEINELDSNFEITDLNDDLVSQLISLTIRKENWNNRSDKQQNDMYMYLIYKLENGAITEILP